MTHQKKIYGLIGQPINHSLSPLMHNAAFSFLGINAEYKLFPLKEEELGKFLKNLVGQDISGLNVTVPYKEKVLPYMDHISYEAKLIGAVNTIKVSSGKLEGFNTDGNGFLKHLTEDLNFDPENRRIALIGAGGAARAISVYLCKVNPKQILIYDADKDKASSLVSYLKANFKNNGIRQATSVKGLEIADSDLLINATPVGVKESDPCLIDAKDIRKGMLVYDLVYNPKETKLLKAAKERGAKLSNGLGMLLYQGMIAFEIWTGKKAPKDVMLKALLEA
ncbi:MAG: shikimate dehydrogenase [Candidatus Omnitrophota bacterium]